MKTGKIIKKMRKERKVRLKDLEKTTGVKYPQIIRYEKGISEPKEKTLLKIMIKGFDLSNTDAVDLINEFIIFEAKNMLSEEKRKEIFG